MHAPPPDPMVPAPFTVARVRRETHDTSTLELVPVNSPFPFRAGQFNMLYAFGIGEVPVSISGDPLREAPLIHTVRTVGAVTAALCRLRPGDTVGVRGPFGASWPVEAAEGMDVVIVAGGIGLAPLRSVIYQLQARRERYGRIALLYGARTPHDLLYGREVAQWRSRFDLQVEVTVDSPSDGWKGNVGVVTTLIPRAAIDPADTMAMVCGPEVMMRFTIAELQTRGVPAEAIYLSMERNMKCAVGLCGHCQFGPHFVCRQGPVFHLPEVEPLMRIREV